MNTPSGAMQASFPVNSLLMMSFPLTVIFFIIAETRERWIQDAVKKSNPTAADRLRQPGI